MKQPKKNQKKITRKYTFDEIKSKFNIDIVPIDQFRLPKNFKFEDFKVYYPEKLLANYGRSASGDSLYKSSANLSSVEFDIFLYSFIKYMQDRFLLSKSTTEDSYRLPVKYEELKLNGYANLMMYTSNDINKFTRIMIESFYDNFVKPYKGRLYKYMSFNTDDNPKVIFPETFEKLLTKFNRRFENSVFGSKIIRTARYNIDGTRSGKRVNNVYKLRASSLFYFPDDYLKESGQVIGVISKRNYIARVFIEPNHEFPIKAYLGRPVYQYLIHNPYEARTNSARYYIETFLGSLTNNVVVRNMQRLYKFISVPASVAYQYRILMNNPSTKHEDNKIAVCFNVLNYDGLKEGINNLLDGKPIDSQNPLKSSFKQDMFKSYGYLYEGFRFLADPDIEYVSAYQSFVNRDRVQQKIKRKRKLKSSDFKIIIKDKLNKRIGDGEKYRLQHIAADSTDIKTHVKVTDTFEYRSTGELKEYYGIQIVGKSLYTEVIPRLISYMRFASAKPLVTLLYKLHMDAVQTTVLTSVQIIQNLKKSLRSKLVDHNIRLSSGIFKKDAAMGTLTKMGNMLALSNPAMLMLLAEQNQLPGLKFMYYFIMNTLKKYGDAIDFNKPLFDLMYDKYVPADYDHDDNFYIMTALKDETKNVSPLNLEYIKTHADFLERYYVTRDLLEKALGSTHHIDELQNIQELTFFVDLVAHNMSNAVTDDFIKSIMPEEANGILRYHPIFSASYRMSKGSYSELFYEDDLTIELRLTSLRHQYVELGDRILSMHSISIPHKLLQNLELYLYGKFEYPEHEPWVYFNHTQMTKYLRQKQLSKQAAGEPDVNMSLVEALLG